MLDFDRVLLEIGEFGRYQKFVVALLLIPACFMNGYNGFGLVMLTNTPGHTCVDDGTNFTGYSTVKYKQCSVEYAFIAANGTLTTTEEPCIAWNYSKEIFRETFITKFNLVCDKALVFKNVLAVIQVCAIFGCFITAYIQDRFGRKAAFVFCTVLYVFGGAASVFMPSVITFVLARSFAAMMAMSSWNVSYIWALEYVGPSKRTLVTTIYCVVYGLAMASISGWAYWLNHWQTLGVVLSVPFILLLSYCWLVHESPRWLLGVGRFDECREVLRTIDKWEPSRTCITVRKKQSLAVVGDVLTRLNTEDEKDEERAAVQDKPATYLDLFTHGANMRAKTILITFCWIANALVYTTIAFNVENIGSNVLVTWTLVASVEAPATLSNLFILNRYGRILPMVLGMILAGISCISTAPASLVGTWLVILLTMVSKFCISMTFGIICQLAGELYPTVARGVGTGLSATFGLVGQTAMPYIIYAAATYRFLPMTIIGVIAVVGGCTSLFLPETMGTSMPQTMHDGETQGIVGLNTMCGHMRRLAMYCGRRKSGAATAKRMASDEDNDEGECSDN